MSKISDDSMYFQQFQTFQLSVYIETDNQKDENKCSMKYFLSIQNSGNMDLNLNEKLNSGFGPNARVNSI